MPATQNVSKRLSIHGRVQGVFYRESMCRKADELGVTGWVRNRSDGTVEAEVQGSPEAVEAMIAWAHEGPAAAHVTHIDVIEGSSGGDADFRRLPTL